MPSRITGQAQLRQVQARLKAVPANLSKEDAKALQEVAPKIAEEIDRQAITHMPHRHGYGLLLSKSMRYRTRITVGKGMTMTVFADSPGGDRRDVPALNRGVLRHPVFGNRNNWVAQRRGVMRHFVFDGLARSENRLVRAIRRARDNVARDIVR